MTADFASPHHRKRAWALWRVGVVLGTGAMERVFPARVEKVPRSPDDLDARWLTSALCGAIPGAQVTSVVRHGASAGTTTRATLELAYNEQGSVAALPERLFAKCTSRLAQRLMLGLGGFIEGEPGFYAEVRPGLAVEAPTGYFGAVDRRSWRSVVLIEDLVSTRHASFCGPSTEVTRERIESLLASAATWHGALWQSPRLARWPWLKTPAEQMQVIDALIALANRTHAGTVRAHAVIPGALHGREPDLYAAMRRSMQLLSEGPHTYLHGDFHIANTYLTGEGTMGVCDWQTSLRGSWAHDYAYIVSTALRVDDRRAWESELLDFYLECLVEAGGAAVPRMRAWDSYRQALFYPYFAWVYTLGRSRHQPNFQPQEISLAMIERISTAIDDLDALAAVGL
jgi:hypothetical protein